MHWQEKIFKENCISNVNKEKGYRTLSKDMKARKNYYFYANIPKSKGVRWIKKEIINLDVIVGIEFGVIYGNSQPIQF